MSLSQLEARVAADLDSLCIDVPGWLPEQQHPAGHVYDVVIAGGGQSGLGIAFALRRERITNVLVIDENPTGGEGPWETYARMVTLRTPKTLTSIDLGIPSLTYRAWHEAQFGADAWEALGKIPRGLWMKYLRWYRRVLNLPVRNETKLVRIEPSSEGLHRLQVNGPGGRTETLLARKVVLATGIQGGGEWHVPELISGSLPKTLYAHTAEPIDFAALQGKRIGILGGGASAFDNANFALEQGVAEAHVFVRRSHLPRINPIRQMEMSGLDEHFAALGDADKYRVMAHFFQHNQPPTNDTFSRAAAWPGFRMHLGSPWLSVRPHGSQAEVVTPHGTDCFDFLVISTGLVTDPALRPELAEVEADIARWSDVYRAPETVANPALDAHPYLSGGFAFTPRDPARAWRLHGLFAFNYSALLNCGLSASALTGLRFAIPRLVTAIGHELFLDERDTIVSSFLSYDVEEFTEEWSMAAD